MSTQTVERATISVLEMAKAMGCSKNTIYIGLHAGNIPAHKIGNRFYIGRQQFYEWLNNGKQIPKGQRV